MRIGFPVAYNLGLESGVHEHFGSAPLFLVVDTETLDFRALSGRNGRRNGDCDSVSGMIAQECDGVAVGGIGSGALDHLVRAGVRVFQAPGLRIADAIALLRSDRLPELDPDAVCNGHNGSDMDCHY